MSKRGKWPVKRSTRLFWQSFSLTFLALIAVFALAFGQLVQKPALEEREKQAQVVEANYASGTNLLLCLRPEERSLPDAFLLVGINGTKRQLALTVLPPCWKVSFANREDSLQQCYGYGGAMECISSLQALTGLRIDYYADLTDQTLAAILDEVGELPYSVAEDIYRYDETSGLLTFKLPYGPQDLSGDKLTGYLRYTKLEGDDKETLRLNLFKAYLDRYLTTQSVAGMSQWFARWSGQCKTNITSVACLQLQKELTEALSGQPKTITAPQIFYSGGRDYDPTQDGMLLKNYFR